MTSVSLFLFGGAGIAVAKRPQVGKRVNAGVVAVLPDRLDGVTADGVQTDELKALRGERWRRTLVQTAKDIGLALAPGAGTIAAQFVEPQVRFMAVVPQNR